MSSTRQRRSQRRGRGNPGVVRDRVTGIAMGLAGIALLAGLAFAWWWATSTRVALNEVNCPVQGPTAVHAILIDRSDPISPLQKQQVMQQVLRLVGAARPGERFDLYVAEGDGTNTIAPAASVCSPGRGADANSYYQNPTMIQRSFEERFVQVLRRELEKLMEPATRSDSPILESIRAVAIGSYGGAERGTIGLRLTIVSDMVQHSRLNSHFRGETTFADLQKRPQWRTLQANLSGVEVSILYLLRSTSRPGGQPIQNRGHQLFWEQVIRASGGQAVALEAF